MSLFKIIFTQFEPSVRSAFLRISALSVLVGLVEATAIGSIMPFIMVISNGELNARWIPQSMHNLGSLGVLSKVDLIYLVGALTLFALWASNITKAALGYKLYRFAAVLECRLSESQLKSYFDRPYSDLYFTDKTQIIRTILTDVEHVVSNVFTPLFVIITRFSIILFSLCILLFMAPYTSIIAFSSVVVVYIVIFRMVAVRLSTYGRSRAEVNSQRYSLLENIVTATREIRMFGLIGPFVERYSKRGTAYSHLTANARTLGEIPRYLIEAVAFSAMVIAVIASQGQGAEATEWLPSIALIAFAAYRLLPPVQQIYNSLTLIRYGLPSLRQFKFNVINSVPSKTGIGERLSIRSKIELANVTFVPPGASSPVVRGVSFSCDVNTITFIVGESGSGKTTILDILAGLLFPTKGFLKIDGKQLENDELIRQQRSVGYVPQRPVIIDGSIAENIAFGLDPEQIDLLELKRATSLASVTEFIDAQENGYDTLLGAAGVKPAGGEAQRIALARALYFRPELLLLDEPTSALDPKTELSIVETLRSLRKNCTIVVVSHNHELARLADNVIVIGKGSVLAKGVAEAVRKWLHSN
jgi:ABC-type multidrug transport system fused ATPase/permease subunit